MQTAQHPLAGIAVIVLHKIEFNIERQPIVLRLVGLQKEPAFIGEDTRFDELYTG